MVFRVNKRGNDVSAVGWLVVGLDLMVGCFQLKDLNRQVTNVLFDEFNLFSFF